MIDLEKIERVAKAAQERSPGPWKIHWAKREAGRVDMVMDSSPKPDDYDGWCGDEWHGKTVLETDSGYYEPKGATAEHIATCSPDVVLALVARIREQGARIAKLESENRDLMIDSESNSFESFKAGRRAFVEARWQIEDDEIAELREFLEQSESDNNAQGDAPILSRKGERALRQLLAAWDGRP